MPWLAVDWPAPTGIRAIMTTRQGGISIPPFDTLNLGDHVHDSPVSVAANRQRMARVMGARPVFLKQVHGVACVEIGPDTPDGTVADGCVTRSTKVACAVMVADCLPVLWAAADGQTVAASHAGWRGLAGQGAADGRGIIETTFTAFSRMAVRDPLAAGRPSGADQPWVWLGPCIGPSAFEVGEEVRAAFLESPLPSAAVRACFDPVSGARGKYRAHLAQLARLRLASMGIHQVGGNDGSDAWCTVTRSQIWFSHRRDAARLGSTGRMAACVWIDGAVQRLSR